MAIADDLGKLVRVDDATRRLYSTDASPFQIQPLAVAIPRSDADILTLIRYADENTHTLVPRGAGTGLAGESLNSGIVVDLSVHFRNILEIGGDYVRVQPGVTLRELNDALAPHGRRFAVAMPNADTVTLGGMIATNAGGGTSAKHGTTARHVKSLRVAFADGDVLTLARDRRTRKDLAWQDLQATLNVEPANPFFRPCGYNLGGGLIDLLVGSEGTLGITLEATLATVPMAKTLTRFILGYATIDAAIDAGRTLTNAAGCDLLDARLLSLARGVLPVPNDVTAALVVTFEDFDAMPVYEMLRANAVVIAEPSGDDTIERFRAAAVSGFYTLASRKRPEAFVEDVGVPSERLAEYIGKAQAIVRDADVSASFLTHVLSGVVHCRPLVDLSDPADQAKAWPLANALHELAISLGGTISAQHGIGIARTPWVEKQLANQLPAMREAKRLFDPKGMLNPGKILGPDPSRPAWPFRSRGQGKELAMAEARKCTGCGDCRTRTLPLRMCPVFRVTGEEAATPRAKANVAESDWTSDDVKAVAKQCVHCTRCRSECPAGVDIPNLMIDAKAARFEANGYDRGEWLIARSDKLAGLASNFAFTTNLLMSWRPTRWLFEKLLGLSRRRMLHRFTHRTFLRRRLVQGLFRRETPGGRKLVYFVDTFANVNDPLLAEATVAVLEHHGFTVAVPQRQRASGMAALSVGDLDTFRKTASYNVRTLAEFVRDGYTVVCSEPSAALALTSEYPQRLGSEDSALVAANTIELTTLLGELHAKGELKPALKPVRLNAAHHTPCHLKTLGAVTAPEWLKAIPQARVVPIDAGCSGAAGSWGLAAVNLDLSLKMGADLFAAMAPFDFAVSECSACRMQIAQGSRRRGLHPVQVLAMGYGLVPQLQKRLTRPLHDRLTG